MAYAFGPKSCCNKPPINHPFHPTVLGSEVHARWAKAKVSPGCSSKAQGGSCCPSGPEDGPRPRHANQGSGHVAPALTPKSPSSAFPLRDSCDDTVPTRALQDNPPPQDPLPCEAHPRVPGIRSGTVGPSFCHWRVPTSSAWKADAVPLCPYGAAPVCLLPSTAGPGHSPLFPPTAVGHHVLPATHTDCSAPCLCPPPAVSAPPSSPPLATFPSPCTGPEGACCKALCFLQQWWPNYFGI